MNKKAERVKFLKALAALWILLISFAVSAQTPFSRGVNFTNWFQTSSAKQIQFTRFTKTDFENVKSLGCDVIRLPINLHAMTSGQPDYTIDPLFLSLLDRVVDWADELQLHLILDNHTFDPAANTSPDIENPLIKVWTQMAAHYKDQSPYLYYEILNEPHGISDTMWGSIQQNVIDAIRSEDQAHYIVVGPANWNSFHNLNALPEYADQKLIYTFHFYDPFLFTHQGASWTNPSMASLSGVPFPYAASTMPELPDELHGTWVEGAYNAYYDEGSVNYLKDLVEIAVAFGKERNAPVYCGEFGVYIPNSNQDDRVAWYYAVRSALEDEGIPWTIWDYRGGFGVFENNSNEFFDYDLNVPLIEALSLDAPPQKTYEYKPATEGFLVYDDFTGEGVFDASNPGSGTLDYFDASSPMVNMYCAYWTGVDQYSAVSFDFKPNLDLHLLENHAHALEFWVRGNSPGSGFEVRFMDTKSGQDDHPWRIGKRIDESVVPWDDSWHKISIRLHDLEETGSYDNGWFPPEGKFDWRNVDRLDFVAEYSALSGIEFWFDDIRVTGDEVPYDGVVTGVSQELRGSVIIKPNPVNSQATVWFRLASSGTVDIEVFDILGQKVKTIAYGNFVAGEHEVVWYAVDDLNQPVSDGIYLILGNLDGSPFVRKTIVRREEK